MHREPTIDFSEIVAIGARVADDEAMFARDVDGRLLRMQKAASADFDADVHLKINGQAITVKRAVPMVDSEGAILRAEDGQPIARFTTIYDAAEAAFVLSTTDRHPIPTLCHREHLPPVGVCRVCIVEAAEMTRRGLRKQLVPACIQRVSEGMEMHTFESSADADAANRVLAAASVVTELLLADHAPNSKLADGSEINGELAVGSSHNELLRVAERLGIKKSRFAPASETRNPDLSSLMIAVDRDECIMCRRCERGCNWVKENFIIGLAGKGYTSHISFDLDESMAQSNCVSCGECAVSCPTGALTFTHQFLHQQKARVEAELRESKQDGTVVPPEELTELPLFNGLPIKFLQLNGSSVIRRVLQTGDVLCREGDYGASAFIIRSGSFAICQTSHSRPIAKARPTMGILGWLGNLTDSLIKPIRGNSAKLADLGGIELLKNETIVCDVDDVILGEMTCMNRSRRSATIVAREPSEVLEIRRNVLDMLLRNRASREILDRVYRRRAVNQLQGLAIFSHLDEAVRKAAANWLKDKVELVRAEPGQVIFQQGDLADDFYMVVLGFIKVSQRFGSFDRVATYLGPGKYFGEIGILSQFASSLPWKDENLRGLRTSTCSALDHVELFRIRGSNFAGLLQQFPELQSAFIDNAQRTLEEDRLAGVKLTEGVDGDFLDQGLFGAQNLLVLDLERCTRCDECTKACADTHQGVTRLIREGMRFDRYLIASSCRSCMDPYCMVGCPVDAIHRNGESLQIEIEDYCIGCGLCAENCPYGNINMHGFPKTEIDPRDGKERKLYQLVDGRKLPVIQQKATTCDMCMEIDGRPSCVYACPHNAAFRVDSEGLKKMLARH